MPAKPDTLAALKSKIRQIGPANGISLHENVISYPLVPVFDEKRLGEYFLGGLADATTRKLIPEAIHYNGVAYSQSLPASHVEKFPLNDCLAIRQPVLFGGVLYNHFAHFVAESIHRLYAYPMFRNIDPYLLFQTPWGLPKYLETNNYANQVLTGFGIPVERLIFVDRVARIAEVIVPTQKYGFGFLHKPDLTFVGFARSFRFPNNVPEGFERAEKIYVSRSGLRKRGAQIGEKIFEEYLTNEDYKVFHPERYTLFEQLAVYTHAKRLIFSEGGALLSCVLLPDLKAEVAVICRRRDPRRNVSMATACLQGYGKRILWIDAVRGQYQFGLETWDALADIDWHEVGRRLCERGFTGNPFRILTDDEHSSLLRSDLKDYLREISGDSRFVEQMVKLKETHPLWTGPSHLVDPRDGLPIWPSPDTQAEAIQESDRPVS
jgi:hypothetical protein